MRRIAVFFVALSSASFAHAQVYTHRDSQGVFHYTRVAVPGSQRLDLPGRPASPLGAPAGTNGAYDEIIHELATRYRVEPALVKAVIRVESRFDPGAVSPRGARGLMQLMPRLARWYGVSNLHDPRQNIRGGVRYLRSLLDRFGDARLALAAYNAGPTWVARLKDRPLDGKLRSYVAAVLRFRGRYREEMFRAGRDEPRD